jgi:type I restriction-modification system DNA methylase subunit
MPHDTRESSPAGSLSAQRPPLWQARAAQGARSAALYVRGRCRDVILPMTVLRGLDAVLKPSKDAVPDMTMTLDRTNITNQDAALRQAVGQAFYNASPFTHRDLRSRSSQQKLRADFIEYLDGFSGNAQGILDGQTASWSPTTVVASTLNRGVRS